MFTGAESGAVCFKSRYNNVKRIETTSGGATITGDLTLTQHLEMGDNDEIRLGDSDDLKIYHAGSNRTLKMLAPAISRYKYKLFIKRLAKVN